MTRTTPRSLLVAMLFLACALPGSSQNTGQAGLPAGTIEAAGQSMQHWWQQTPIVANGGQNPPGMDDLLTVVGWGNSAETARQEAYAKRRATRLHSSGIRFVGMISVFDASFTTYQERPELAAFAVVDLEGKPIIVEWESTPEKPLLWGNTNTSGWQDFLLEQARRLVDAGADGLIFDESQGTVGSIHYGGSFGEPDMSLFRAYLEHTMTARELKTRFGIQDLSTFNYGDYIRSRGLAATWKAGNWWKVPLGNEFVKFQRQAGVRVMERIVRETKAYARKTYGREISTSANVYGLRASQLEFAHLWDYFTVEYPILDNGYPPRDRTVIDYKLARALGDRPAWTLPSVNTIADFFKRNSVTNLLRLGTAEAYAARGATFIPWRVYGWTKETGPEWYQGDVAALRPFYTFARDHADLLDGRAYRSNVALIYSLPSETKNSRAYLGSYRGTAVALLEAHAQFDVVALGNGTSVPAWPDGTGLAPYAAAFLPSGACLSDQQLSRILNWVATGGTLIAWGETATRDLSGQSVVRPKLAPLLSPGTHQLGRGRIIVLPDDLGTRYREERSPEARLRIASLLQTAAPEIVSTSAPPQVVILTDIALEGSALLLHLLNGDYDSSTDQIRATSGFSVQATLLPVLRNSRELQAYLLSPERSLPARIPCTRQGDRVSVECSSLHIYDLVVFIDENRARELTAPALRALTAGWDAAVARGRDLSTLAHQRASLDIATSVHDHLKAQCLARETLAKVRQLERRRILFDEAHDERNTLSRERALTIDAGHPEWILTTRLPAALADEFVFERNESAPLSAALLPQYDAIMLAAPRRRFNATEMNTLHEYVARGGGLIVLGDAGLDLTAITQRYGIAFSAPAILEPGIPPNGNLFFRNFAQHDAMKGVSTIASNWGGRLELSAPAIPLAYTAATAWQDVNRNRAQDADEPTGPFVIAAASGQGAGRVVALPDNCIHDDSFDFYGNETAVRSMLRWVAGAQKKAGPDTGSSSAVSSPKTPASEARP